MCVSLGAVLGCGLDLHCDLLVRAHLQGALGAGIKAQRANSSSKVQLTWIAEL